MAQTVVGLYDTFEYARSTVEDLVEAGFDREHISLVTHDPDKRYASEYGARDPDEAFSEEAAVGGSTAGAVLGGIVGLALAPFFAFGPVAGALVGAGVGAAGGGLAGGLVGAGLEEEDAQVYAEGVRRGGTLVTVETTERQTDDAVRILNRHNPVDIDQRADRWREAGWTGHSPEADFYSPSEAEEERERLMNVGAEMRSTGAMGARGAAGTDRQAAADRADDEIEVRNRMFHTDIGGDAVSDTLRADFRKHYEENFAGSGVPYEEYERAYIYGYQFGSVNEDRQWDEVEPEVERRWMTEPDNRAFNDVKNAAIYGWRSAGQTDNPAVD